MAIKSKKQKFEDYNTRRNRVLKAIPRKLFQGHYNPINILEKGASYSMIIALRNNGKSTAMTILILFAWYNFGYPSCWVRRMKESLTAANVKDLFNTAFHLVPNKKGYDGIMYRNGRFYGYWNRDKNKKELDTPFCYTKSLNAGETSKGTMDIPNLLFIVFDEFMSRDHYLNNEFVLFTNLMSTVFRESYYASVVMLGNPVSWSCPYFNEMGLKNVRDIPLGTIKYYVSKGTKTSVALEMCGESQRNIHTDIINDRFFGFDNKQLESIKFGTWELPMYPHPVGTKEDTLIDRSCYIIYDNDTLCIEIYKKADRSTYVLVRPYKAELDYNDKRVRRIYKQRDALGVDNWRVKTKIQNDKIDNLIWKMMYKNNQFYYSDNMVGETVRLFLNEYLSNNY